MAGGEDGAQGAQGREARRGWRGEPRLSPLLLPCSRPAHSHCRAARAMLRRVRHALPSVQSRTGALAHAAQTKKRKNSKFDKGKKIQSGAMPPPRAPT